ncbi:response regulator transcription factor [Loigolactobacillus zhaoyuanensis]|uniref:Response regulator transcription factor n=2 Tax=Loigolactobacillus zhaoyuanensis TaxID=2486017 RepID=A0ABW8U8Z8_9LACO
MIKVMIVDNHPVFRAGLKAIFDEDASFEIVGEAENG